MNLNPTYAKKYKKSFLFGAVVIDYHIENTSPHKNVNDKYKHIIYLNILGKTRLAWVLNTQFEHVDLPYEK